MISRYGLVKLYRKTVIRYAPFKVGVYIDYFRRKKKFLSLKDPKGFAEKIQWIKVNGNLEKYSYLVDKYEVRKYIQDRVGDGYLNDIHGIYDDVEDIDFDALPNEFVLKLTNGSGYNLICKDKSELNIEETKKTLRKWLKVDYYKENKEIQYKNVKSRIMVEKFLKDDSGELMDYKIFCFDGKARFVEVDRGRFSGITQNMYDTDWNKINLQYGYYTNHELDEKPARFDEMVDLAEKLSADIPFTRMDFYYVNDEIIFGEVTLTPQNGLVSFWPEEEDPKIAKLIDLDKYK